MAKNARAMTKAQQAGESDGWTAALSKGCRDYSDDFIRRTALTEDDRAEYRDSWYASHETTSKLYRVGRYSDLPVSPAVQAECRRIVARMMRGTP